MANHPYFDFCEELFQTWLQEKVSLSNGMEPIFQMDHVPEPYLIFEAGDHPLVFLTTNPGSGLPIQCRSCIKEGGSVVKTTERYADAAIGFANWYRQHLKGAARRRIEKFISLSNTAGYDGVMAVESIPFHSAKLPNKEELCGKLKGDPWMEKYIHHIRNFLKDKNVVCLSAANPRRSLDMETISASSWLDWQSKLIGIDLGRASFHAIRRKGEKITGSVIIESSNDMAKTFVLVTGSNNFPRKEDMEKIAVILKKKG